MDVMNIGFFGDSYVDLNLEFHKQYPAADEKYSIWGYRVCKELNLLPVTSGLGGTNQYYAIKTWQDYVEYSPAPDVAVFTFTWDHRLYSSEKNWQAVLSLAVEKKDLARMMEVPAEIDDIRKGVELYYRYLHNNNQAAFNHEQSIRWCLELPKAFPSTKFIFLPNTEQSRIFALKHFQSGVLIDFAFETLSAMEGERVGVDPFDYEKVGHLTESNHVKIKNLIKDIIVNYNNYVDKVYKLNYEDFKL